MAEPIEMPFGMWTRVDQRSYVIDGVQIPPWEGHFWAGWIWDFPAHRRAQFPLAVTLGFPCMLSASIPNGWTHNPSSVTLNFANEKFPAMRPLGIFFNLLFWIFPLILTIVWHHCRMWRLLTDREQSFQTTMSMRSTFVKTYQLAWKFAAVRRMKKSLRETVGLLSR